MELSVISHNAHKFLAKCEECRHGGGGQCLALSSPDNIDFMLAALGAAQKQPRMRHYAASIALNESRIRKESPWWETWISLDKPCDSFCLAS